MTWLTWLFGLREILTWLDVPEKFVILHARTLYFGICSSIREKISTSSKSELQTSNECTSREKKLENIPKKSLSSSLFLIYADLFYEQHYIIYFRFMLMNHKGTRERQIKNDGKRVRKSDDLALTCHGRSIIILLWYVWQARWNSYAMLLKSSFNVGRKHR